MNDVTLVDVLDGFHDRSHQVGRVATSVLGMGISHEILYVRFMVVALGTYPVEKFSASA